MISIVFLSTKKLKIKDVQVINSYKKGRGIACYAGVKKAKGDVILFLHGDTTLPKNWKSAIESALENGYAGGAFSLLFTKQNKYLSFLTFLSNMLFYLTGELWGDRAIFVKKSVLVKCKKALNVPIMEDVRLSKCIRHHGKTILLKEKVVTSSRAFEANGFVNQTFKILKCRIMYTLGYAMHKIYNCYYDC